MSNCIMFNWILSDCITSGRILHAVSDVRYSKLRLYNIKLYNEMQTVSNVRQSRVRLYNVRLYNLMQTISNVRPLLVRWRTDCKWLYKTQALSDTQMRGQSKRTIGHASGNQMDPWCRDLYICICTDHSGIIDDFRDGWGRVGTNISLHSWNIWMLDHRGQKIG